MQIIPCFSVGGAERMCETLTYELIKKGHRVIVVSLYSIRTMITERLENNGVEIRYLEKRNGFDLKCIKKLKKIIKEENPDIIHTHLYSLKYAVFATLFKKNKIVHTIHNVAKEESSRADRFFNKFWFKRGKVVPVALSTIVKKTILDEYKIKNRLVPIIFNGIDLTDSIKKTDYDIHNGRFVFIHVGRFSSQKNHILLVGAFSRLLIKHSNCFLVLVGDGELRKNIENHVKELGIDDKVSFLGLRNDISSLMHNSDAFVLPSLYEGIPMTLIEAMASGLPIVATDVGGVSEMISNSVEGILCEVNSNALYESMNYLVSDKSFRERIGCNAQKKAISCFSSTKMAESYSSLYKCVIKKETYDG